MDIGKHNNQILEQVIIPLINITMAKFWCTSISADLLAHVVLYTSATVGISTFSSIKHATPVSVDSFSGNFFSNSKWSIQVGGHYTHHDLVDLTCSLY